MNRLQLPSPGSTLPKTILAMAFGAALVILATAAGAYFVLVKPPMDAVSKTAHEIASVFDSVFHFTPTVVANERTIVAQTRPALKLTLVERDVSEMIEWSESWAGSTKTIMIEGIYRASAGFDLEKDFRVSVEKNPMRVTAELPQAELLALEVKDYKVLKDENGWWNKVQPQEREVLLNQLHEKARLKAEQSGILADARAAVEKRLGEIASRNGCELRLRYPVRQSMPGGRDSVEP